MYADPAGELEWEPWSWSDTVALSVVVVWNVDMCRCAAVHVCLPTSVLLFAHRGFDATAASASAVKHQHLSQPSASSDVFAA